MARKLAQVHSISGFIKLGNTPEQLEMMAGVVHMMILD
jgi:hypothetical protein